MNNSVYPTNHITERKIVEKGKLKTTNFSGDEVQVRKTPGGVLIGLSKER